MSIAETDEEVQTVSDGGEMDVNGDARMRKPAGDDSPHSRVPMASAREVISKSDAEAGRDALRAAADAAAALAAATTRSIPLLNPYQAAALSERSAASKERDSARTGMPPPLAPKDNRLPKKNTSPEKRPKLTHQAVPPTNPAVHGLAAPPTFRWTCITWRRKC